MVNPVEIRGDRFRDVFWMYLEEIIELIDPAVVDNDEPDWVFLQHCADAYPSAVGGDHCTVVLANVLGRCVIRTRTRRDVDAIPVRTPDYLDRVTME